MRFHELALQGIGDLVDAAQARLTPGYNALLAPRERAATVVLALDELLFADGFRPEAASLAAPGAASSRAAATLETSDGSTFRIVRDLASGAVRLTSWDKAKNQYVPVSTVAAEIGQFLRGRLGMPSRRGFGSAFVLRAADLPSAWGANKDTAPNAAPPSASPRVDTAAQRARLTEVEAQLVASEAGQKIEWELDGLQKRRFEIDDELGKLRFDDRALAEAQALSEQLAFLDAAGGEALLHRHEAYEGLVARRNTDMKRWEEEREHLMRTTPTGRPASVVRDWRVYGGLGAGLLAIGIGAVLGSVWRYVALLDIPAFGLAVWSLWQHIEQREQLAAGRRRVALSDERRAKILARDAEEITAVEALLAKLDLQSADEIRDALARRAQAQQALAAAREARQQATENPRVAALTAEKRVLDRKIATMEERLAAGAVEASEIAALRDEARRLRTMLDAPQGPTPTTTAQVAPDEDLRQQVARWLGGVQDLWLTDVSELLPVLAKHASTLVAKLTSGRLTALRLAHTGTLEVVSVQGESRSWSSLAPGARDTVFLAVRGGLVAALDQARRLPVVVDVPSDLVWGGAPVLQAFVQALAETTQVIHLVARRDEAAGAAQPFGPES